MTHITVQDDKPSVIYRYTPKEPATVVDGVPARDLTEFDLAAMNTSQRLRLKFIAEQDDGAYELEGDVPKGLSFEPPPTPDPPPGGNDPELNAMTRADLNTHAAALGIEAPELFANKGELIAAIEATSGKKG